MSLRDRFTAFDDTLAAHGVPPLTSWWREGIGAWLDDYEAGGALELWACVGRGAAKSTAIYKLALFFALFGDFEIPIAERHYAIVLSRLKSEAEKGIGIISGWCTLLGVAHRPVGDVIELVELRRGVRVVAASVAATSGWRAFFVARDERAKWPSSGVEETDAEEIDASATQMTATHPRAPNVWMGSAWVALGRFYEVVMEGSSASRAVLGPAPSWIAAPHLRKEDLQKKESDPRRFARENECIFQAGDLTCFDPEQYEPCFTNVAYANLQPIDGPVMVIDSSMGRGDSYTWAALQWTQPQEDERHSHLWMVLTENRGQVREDQLREDDIINATQFTPAIDADGYMIPNPMYGAAPLPRLVMFGMKALVGRFAVDGGGRRGLTSDDVVATVAADARRLGAVRVIGDQYGRFLLESAFARHGLTYCAVDWTNAEKSTGVLRTRQWFRERTIAIDDGPEARELRTELQAFREKVLPSGAIGFGARAGAHDDRVALLISAAIADTQELLRGSPLRRDRRRHEW